MRELNRKLDRYLKEKAAKPKQQKSAKGSATPHVTYEVMSPTTATSNRKANSRQFSMTLSFFNPKFDKVYPKDFVIRHEDLKQRQIASQQSARERYVSPRRDPILQDNNEGVIEFKPCVKRLPVSDRVAMFSEEPVYSSKKKGDYNPLVHARSLSPKREGLRTGLAPYRDPAQDIVKRQLKGVENRHQIKANPITEGDIEGVKLIKVRSPPEISEETKRLNDLAFTLSADRGNSRKGRVFWDTKIQLNTDRPEYDPEERYSSPRPQHKLAKSDEMRETIEYGQALPYRDQGVTGKVTNVAIKDYLRSSTN